MGYKLLSGVAMNYEIIRSKRKTLCLKINDDLSLTVKAPLYVSDKKIEEFVQSHKAWVDKNSELIKKKNELKNIARFNEKMLREQAEAVIPQKVEYYSALMGLKPNGIKITSAQKRFGSCSGKNSLCFSYMLMLYPDRAVDYVVVHELAHIKYHNHSKNFYKLIEKYLPDYKEREKLLKRKNPKQTKRSVLDFLVGVFITDLVKIK